MVMAVHTEMMFLCKNYNYMFRFLLETKKFFNEIEKGWQSLKIESMTPDCEASALPLSHDYQTTTSPYNPLAMCTTFSL